MNFIWSAIKSLVKRLFCAHEWAMDSHRYAVIRRDGSQEGEITISVLKCKCGATKVLVTDRTHHKNQPT